MRMQWYRDEKDIAKWATLMEIVSLEDIGLIVQVAMWTDQPHQDYPDLTRDLVRAADDADFVACVTDHFRELNGVKSLADDFGIEIVVWPELFTHAGRGGYFNRVHDAIRESTSRTLWLFDPDNGIEPARRVTNKHVCLQELAGVYGLIPEGDYITVYQHNTRRKNWPDKARQRLSEALGGHTVELYRSEVTGQAVMLAVRKE